MIDMRLGDCMDLMADTPDGFYDLAIVDPPYGIGRLSSGGMSNAHGFKTWERKHWDASIPNAEYFLELRRVSCQQIVWGGNYFTEYLPSSMGWVFWFKQKGMTFADGEMAWTSFDQAIRVFDDPSVLARDGRIHPTQKPVALYKWLLTRYAKPGQAILDTHGGSGSICIACHDLGFDLTWIEKDEDYYSAAVKRYREHARQASLFQPEEVAAVPREQELFDD